MPAPDPVATLSQPPLAPPAAPTGVPPAGGPPAGGPPAGAPPAGASAATPSPEFAGLLAPLLIAAALLPDGAPPPPALSPALPPAMPPAGVQSGADAASSRPGRVIRGEDRGPSPGRLEHAKDLDPRTPPRLLNEAALAVSLPLFGQPVPLPPAPVTAPAVTGAGPEPPPPSEHGAPAVAPLSPAAVSDRAALAPPPRIAEGDQPKPGAERTGAPPSAPPDPMVTAPPPAPLAAESAAAAKPVPPAEQLAPVLISIVRDPGGARHVTLQLQPEALGSVQIQIEHTPGTPMQVRILADRPETLALLQRDAPQLQHALERAGVTRDGMTLSFHAAPAVAPPSSASDSAGASTQFLGTGQPHQGFSDGRAHRHRAGPQPGGADIDASGPDPTRRMPRSSLDITA